MAVFCVVINNIQPKLKKKISTGLGTESLVMEITHNWYRNAFVNHESMIKIGKLAIRRLPLSQCPINTFSN